MITELRAKGSKELTRQRSGQSFIAEQVCRFPVMGGDKVPSKNEGARMWERTGEEQPNGAVPPESGRRCGTFTLKEMKSHWRVLSQKVCD